LDKVTIFKL